MNNPIVQWLKSNILIVIFAVLIIGAFVGLPLVASNMGNTVQNAIEEREQLARNLAQLENTPIDLRDPTPLFNPPTGQQALINPAALTAFRTYVEERNEQASAIVDAAVAFNRKGRGVLVPRLFPNPPGSDIPVLTKEMSDRLQQAYRDLLDTVDAGQPPTLEEMRESLTRTQKQFITSRLNKESMDELTDTERARLEEELSGRRLSMVRERAQSLKLYASMTAFDIPSWDYGQSPMPTVADLFEWQWDFWATQDIVAAINDANANADNVIGSAVKRIKLIRPSDSSGVASEEDNRRNRGNQRGGGDRRPGRPPIPGGGGMGGPTPGGGGGGMGAPIGGNTSGGGERGGSGRNQEQAAGDAPLPIDPTKEVEPDYTTSLTGRTMSGLYDVRYYRVHVVVESEEIPTFLNALSRRNFMTVVGLRMYPTDPYADLEDGFLYGPRPTTELVLTVETVWLREWTKQFMPAATKLALRVPTDDDGQSQGGAPPAQP